MTHYDALPLNDRLYYTVSDFAEQANVHPQTVRNALNSNDSHYKPELSSFVITVGSERKVFIDHTAQTLFSSKGDSS